MKSARPAPRNSGNRSASAALKPRGSDPVPAKPEVKPAAIPALPDLPDPVDARFATGFTPGAAAAPAVIPLELEPAPASGAGLAACGPLQSPRVLVIQPPSPSRPAPARWRRCRPLEPAPEPSDAVMACRGASGTSRRRPRLAATRR